MPQPIKKLLLHLFHFLSAATTHHLSFSLCTPSIWLLVPFQLQLLLKRGMILHLSSLPQQSRNPWRILSSYNSESYISMTFNLGLFFTMSSPSILLTTLIQPKKDNKKLTEQVTQLQAKVQSLQSSIAPSTTIDEIQSYEKHCLDLITPATTHCIMKELGFPAVKEIPNSSNITSLLSCGVTHRSPFAQQWFTIFQGQESTITGVSIQKFANNTSNKLFWTKSLAVPTVAQVQVECNSFAKYICDILAMQFFPVPDFKQLANKDSSESDLLKLAFEQALDGDYDVSGKGPHSPYVCFLCHEGCFSLLCCPLWP